MYYNRFGRCNRGERCPYVHDPEKVAVCTRCVPHPQAGAGRRGATAALGSRPSDPPCVRRFVRGTCKKTDGTCPFSHHVSKEKVSFPCVCWPEQPQGSAPPPC